VNSTATSAVLQPATAEDVAVALQRASAARQTIVIRGAGTKMDWGRAGGPVDIVLDMRRLNRMLAHQHGDLTATIEAGATLREVNEALARHGQWLPLDPPFADRATIGGILATNDSGPLRHRFGTPRDLVIGVTLALTDGTLAKAGGQVVKNVAGYDLSKLVTGSFGSLAAVVSATFKLSPLPAASKTLAMQVPDATALGRIVREMMASQLEPIAFEIAASRLVQSPQRPQSKDFSANSAISAFDVLLRFASLPAVVDAQIEGAQAALKGCATSSRVADGDAARALWREHATGMWDAPGAVVRASWLPAAIVEVAAEIDRVTGDAQLAGRAAIGSGLIRIGGDDAAQAAAIEQLRRSPHLGNVVIMRASAAVKGRVDVWGPLGDREPLLASMKRAFDPDGVLNAGRGPL
jgi:glycolate oxidase FAD binding subunit